MKAKPYTRKFLARKQFDLDGRFRFIPLLLMLAGACAYFDPWMGPSSYDRCVERLWMEMKALPEKKQHRTLDGQDIDLHAYSLYGLANHLAVLPFKFYHWQNEVWKFESPPHKARVYLNMGSTCLGYKRFDPELGTYGDFAELYDSHGVFMGFAVRIDRDVYFPLKAFNYNGQWKTCFVEISFK